MTNTPESQQPINSALLGEPQPSGAAEVTPTQQTQPTVQLPETDKVQIPQAPQVPQAPHATPVYAPHPSHLPGYATAQPGYAAGQPQYDSSQVYSAPHPRVAAPVSSPAAANATQQAQPERKSRAGAWIAGIAIGAVIGGVVGGGASALIMANQPAPAVVQPQSPSGVITLDNLDNATSVSAVAAVGAPSVVTLEVMSTSARGSGSGVIYNDAGYILTNAHVVTLDGAAGSDPEIRVWLTDGRILDGELVGTDPFADIAVVKIDADNLTPIAIADSSEVNVGDLAVAIGAPLNLSNTVTSGVVSALYRGISVGSTIIPEESNDTEQPEQIDPNAEGEFPWFRFGNPNEGQQQTPQQSQGIATRVTLPVIQTDASINPGNSGGALLNSNAELIGVNVAIASNSVESGTAGSVGLGFAVPANLAIRVAESLIAGERPSHGLLGVSVQDSSNDIDEDRNTAGALLEDVVRGGAADQAGLRVGDVIYSVNGVPADSGTTASALIRMHEGGSEIQIGYSRGGVRSETTVTLGTLEW